MQFCITSFHVKVGPDSKIILLRQPKSTLFIIKILVQRRAIVIVKHKSLHTTQKSQNHKVNRKYKDRLFRYIFKNKKDLLELYNAINGTSYTDVSDLTIDYAIDDCIQMEILSDILIANRTEIKNMLLSTFNEKEYRKMLRDEARAEGFQEGRAEGQQKGQKELNDLYEALPGEGRTNDLEKAIKDNEYRQKLLKERS